MNDEEEVQVETKVEAGFGVGVGVGVGVGGATRREATPSSTSPVRKAVFVQSRWNVDDRKRLRSAQVV